VSSFVHMAHPVLNAELGILRRILKRANLWARIADDIPPSESRTIGRAITEEEKQRAAFQGGSDTA